MEDSEKKKIRKYFIISLISLLLYLSLVKADHMVVNNHTSVMNISQVGLTIASGTYFRFTTTGNLSAITFKRPNGATFQSLHFLNQSGTEIKNCAFSAVTDECTINFSSLTNFPIQNYDYRIDVNSNGSAYTRYYGDVTSYYPKARSNITWITAYYNGVNYSQFIWGITQMNLSWVQYVCTASLKNTTPTNLTNISSCSILDLYSTQYNYTTYDENNCPGSSNSSYSINTTLTCNYCESTYFNTSVCNLSYINEQESDKNMIAMVLIYMVFMALGYYMIKTGSLWSGWLIYSITILFDFFFAGQIYKTYNGDITAGITGQMTWIFITGLILWITAKVGSLVLLQVKIYGK